MSLRGRHARASVAPTVRFLIVSLRGTYFALHADRIQGLLTVEEAGTSQVVTAQWRTYPRIELAERFRMPAGSDGPGTRIVLLSRGAVRGHLRVDGVVGLKEVDASLVLPLPRQFQGEEQRWYQGMVLIEEGVALILNPSWLLEGDDGAAAWTGSETALRPSAAGGQR
jgi:chemotaxis protein histidine kinase CheA